MLDSQDETTHTEETVQETDGIRIHTLVLAMTMYGHWAMLVYNSSKCWLLSLLLRFESEKHNSCLGEPSQTRVSQGLKMKARTGSRVLVLLTVAALLCTCSCAQAAAKKAPALWVFGDSTVDTGNQNYITSVIKSNFPPYGKDFVPPGPTGRFCNGKVANDFLADFLEIPRPVNYLAPEAKGARVLTGVNLASSGSGYLDITGALFGVLNLTRQLDNFGLVKKDIIGQIGEESTNKLFRESIYLISTGSNDYVNSYNINPLLQAKFTPEAYEKLLLGTIETNLKTLYNYGARRVFIDSLSPLGCVPEQLVFGGSTDGKCIEKVNTPVKSFNSGLQATLAAIRSELPDYDLVYVNVYDPIFSFITEPTRNGFKFGNTACCGEGPYKGLPCANPISDVCDNADDYVFWDLFHPTQKTYERLSRNIISGSTLFTFPMNLQQMLAKPV